MELEPIRDLLLAEDIENVYISHLPSAIKKGILLRQSFAGTRINHYLPGFLKTDFTVICRAEDYETAKQMMKDVTAIISFERQRALGDMLVRYIRPQTKPVDFPLSDGDLIEFKCVFDICFNE